jgi:hypothetical protein
MEIHYGPRSLHAELEVHLGEFAERRRARRVVRVRGDRAPARRH